MKKVIILGLVMLLAMLGLLIVGSLST